MPRFHATSEGNIQFSSEEEAKRDAEEKAWADGSATRAWANLRQERDRKLASSDWMASSDLTLADDWKAHRKALRDFPATLNDAKVQAKITWPTEPS